MWLLDLLFPPRCVACDRLVADARPMCRACSDSLYPLGLACPRCAEPLDGVPAGPCRRCRRRPPPFAGVVAPWRYGGELATALVRLKFGGRSDLVPRLAPLYRDVLVAAAGACDLVVPVPLHWRRRMMRGFDQAALLAGGAGRLPVPLDCTLLRRVRATPPQTSRGAEERRQNLAGAFVVCARRRSVVRNRRVLVVDDVITTGATLAAAARALRDAGAREIMGFAIARAESPGG